jgi:hypothetical protein
MISLQEPFVFIVNIPTFFQIQIQIQESEVSLQCKYSFSAVCLKMYKMFKSTEKKLCMYMLIKYK